MYNNDQIEQRNLTIATFELNYEILRIYLINFYRMNISGKDVSLKECINKLKTNKVITKQEFDEIENFTRKKVYFCRLIDKNNGNITISEIEKYSDYLQSFLDMFIDHINSKYNLDNTYPNLLEEE